MTQFFNPPSKTDECQGQIITGQVAPVMQPLHFAGNTKNSNCGASRITGY